jgi:hypothetical protein
MDKYIKALYTGKGFISHEDVSSWNLQFEIMVQQSDYAYIKVTGDEPNIAYWVTKVGGIEVLLTDIQIIIDSLPPTSEEEINELKQQVEDLTLQVADLTAQVTGV